MSTLMPRLRAAPAALFAGALLVLLGVSSVVIVGEGDQAVITRLGRPVSVINRFQPAGPQARSGAGAVLKLPFIDQVVWLKRGLLGFSSPGQKVRSSDEQVLLVDTDVTYRIIDPVRLVGTLGDTAKIGEQIKAILPSLLEQQLAQQSAQAIATPGTGGAAQHMLTALDAKLRAYGVQAVDLRIGRVVLPEGGMQLAYDRMQRRHDQQAWDVQNDSARDARQIVADADIKAAVILQVSAGQDPEFYSFFRALRSYSANFADPKRKNATPIVLAPGSGYLKHFDGN